MVEKEGIVFKKDIASRLMATGAVLLAVASSGVAYKMHRENLGYQDQIASVRAELRQITYEQKMDKVDKSAIEHQLKDTQVGLCFTENLLNVATGNEPIGDLNACQDRRVQQKQVLDSLK